LNRQAAKAGKDEQTERSKLKKVLTLLHFPALLPKALSLVYPFGAIAIPAKTLFLSNQAIQQNHTDIAKIYAQNAIRKQNERLNLLRLASRIDAVSSRVQTAVTMRQVTGSMANVVKGMDSAMKAMDLEKVDHPCKNTLTHNFPADYKPLSSTYKLLD